MKDTSESYKNQKGSCFKPRILVVADVPGWALDRTADNIISRLGDYYLFEKAFNRDGPEKIRKKKFELLYITYWRQFTDADIVIDIPETAITGIRSHFKWDGGCNSSPSQDVIDCLNNFNALNVPSLTLYNIFREKHPAVFYTPHGVDETVFFPRRRGHCLSSEEGFVIGWSGSRDNHPGKRGIDDFIIPAVQKTSGVTLKFAVREEKWRTQEEMAAFYNSIDAYICASRTEGGPHPLLEAASCGVPLISTRVGIAPQLIIPNENGILVDRTVDAISRAIVSLRDNKEMRIRMGIKARQIVEKQWTWDIQAKQYIPFFNYGLRKLKHRYEQTADCKCG